MKANILLFSLLLISSSIFGQIVKEFQPNRESLKNFDLKGKISKVESITSFQGSNTKNKNEYIFNEAGYPIYKIINNDTIHSFFYDDKSNLIKYVYNYDGEFSITTYEVDENNNIKKILREGYNQDFIVESNKVINKNKYWIFDNNGNIIESNSSGFLTKYKYNDKNQLVEEKGYESDGSLRYTCLYQYNRQGDKTSFNESFVKHGSNYSEYKYEYDKYDNWIKKITKEDGKVSITEKRTITYKDNLPAAKSGKKK